MHESHLLATQQPPPPRCGRTLKLGRRTRIARHSPQAVGALEERLIIFAEQRGEVGGFVGGAVDDYDVRPRQALPWILPFAADTNKSNRVSEELY